jgi:hypothetical protein
MQMFAHFEHQAVCPAFALKEFLIYFGTDPLSDGEFANIFSTPQVSF